MAESVTDFSGSISGVGEPPLGKKPRVWKYGLTVTRKVDRLSPQFAAALAGGLGKSFSKVKIQTPSGHVVTLRDTWVVKITKSGSSESIGWECTAAIEVDCVVRNAAYNWKGLNS